MCTLNVLPAASWPFFSFSTMSGSPAAARKVGSQSWCWTISLETTPAGILPGQRTIIGTRNAPSQFVFFSLRKGVVPASGQVFMCGPLSVAVHDDRVLSDPELVEQIEQLADVLVVVDHRVVVGRLPAAGLARGSGASCASGGACA